MENNNIPEQAAANASKAPEQPQVQPVPQPKRDLSKITFKGKTIKVTTMIKWAVILLVFLVITNPGIIPFLPQEAKATITTAWTKIFGDVEKISGTFEFNWATIFQVVAIILMMILLTSVIRFIIQHIHPKSSKGRSAVSLLNSATSYITTLICFFWCLSAIGINMTAILASVGIIALIVGFGAQSLVEDLVTGIFLVFEDQFNVGDYIEVDGFRGVVDHIGIRVTTVKGMGSNYKILNNSSIKNILNRSQTASIATTSVSVSYKEDVRHVEQVLNELFPKIREMYPEVFLEDPKNLGIEELGDSGVVFKIAATISEKDLFTAPRIMNREIKIAFDDAGIEIPFPQVVVHQEA